MDSSIYQQCVQQFPAGNTTVMMECISNSLQRTEEQREDNFENFLHVIVGAMVFLMQAGFSMVCAGSVRIKNVQNTMLKNLLDACGAAIAFYLVGYAFAFGGQNDRTNTTFIGTSDFASVGDRASFWFFQYTFTATSVTIVAGTLAERCQMAAYLCYSVVLVGFVYPVIAHSVWSNNGFLSATNADPFLGVGAHDFAGSGVIHLTGGTTALFATMLLGPRRGRFYDSQGEPLETPKPFPGHSMALQLLGTMILWFGWFGFNGGSALLLPETDHLGENAANAAVSTALAGAMAGMSALFTNYWQEERRTGEPSFDLVMCMNGSLSGLVAVTAGCGIIEPYAAVVVGLVAGWLYIWGAKLLIRLRIDDAVNAIPVHMINGIWGLLSVGLFASPRKLEITFGNSEYGGWFYNFDNGRFLAAQICTILFILGWTLATMLPFFFWLSYKGWLRSDSLEELVGLDVSYHGGVNAAGATSVKKEFVDAFNRNVSGNMRNRKVGSRSTQETSDFEDPEIAHEAAAAEAMMDD